MLRGSTLSDTYQIIGESADCSGWTRMEGQGGMVECVQQFHVKYRLVCFTMLCKIQVFYSGKQGIDSYSTSRLARFEIGFGK